MHNARNPASERLRRLPAVDALLREPQAAEWIARFGRAEVVRALRAALDAAREAIRSGRDAPTDPTALCAEAGRHLSRRAVPSLRPVINATGIVLHTGLGRAPLAREAVEQIAAVAAGYSSLELDLATGRRGDRHRHVRALLCELTGAEDALVVNNNAAGTLLALATLAGGREAIVSRGQLVEIGGSYRMPEIMAAAGCRLVEVGTTNRTRLSDYARAIDDDTAVLLRVHTSNYRICGFVEQVGIEALVRLAREHGLRVIDDLGSGLLTRWVAAPDHDPAAPAPQRWDEPSVEESIVAGADLVLFSGDKLLGGPQAGVIVGRGECIAALRANPLARALRPDKLTLAGLEATLKLYRDRDTLAQKLPVWRMLLASPQTLRRRASRLAGLIRRHCPQADVQVRPDASEAGGGSLPTLPLPTWVVAVTLPGVEAGALAARLRGRERPILTRVRDERLLFDVRTLEDEQFREIAEALRSEAGDA